MKTITSEMKKNAEVIEKKLLWLEEIIALRIEELLNQEKSKYREPDFSDTECEDTFYIAFVKKT